MRPRALIVPLILLGVWAILSYGGIVSEFFLATPNSTAVRMYELLRSGDILRDIAATLYRVVVGLGIGSAIGLSAGLLIGLVPWLWRYTESTVDFFRSLPAFALFPFFILIFGPGDPAKIGTTSWFVAFIMLIATSYAVRSVNDTRMKAAKSLGASRLQAFFWVVLPDGLPQLLVGFRTCLAFAPIVVVATEMFSGTEYGLGDRIYEARLLYRVPEMYAALLMSGIIGFALNRLFLVLVEKRIHWTGK